MTAGQPPCGVPALGVLKDAGLVVDRAADTRRLYQLKAKGVGAMRGYLDRFWDRALAAFATAVEQDDEEETRARARSNRFESSSPC